MTVCLTKLHAFDYDRQTWTTGPTAAILHLHRLPDIRTALADPDYRTRTRRDTLAAWATATAEMDTLEAQCLAVLAPAVRVGCFAEPGDMLVTWDDDDEGEAPDTCLNRIDGHWYVVTYGRAPYSIHALDCATCAAASVTA